MTWLLNVADVAYDVANDIEDDVIEPICYLVQFRLATKMGQTFLSPLINFQLNQLYIDGIKFSPTSLSCAAH